MSTRRGKTEGRGDPVEVQVIAEDPESGAAVDGGCQVFKVMHRRRIAEWVVYRAVIDVALACDRTALRSNGLANVFGMSRRTQPVRSVYLLAFCSMPLLGS